MSYDISFRAKLEGVDEWVPLPFDTEANTTWNLREMIMKSTGLEWKNEEDNGYVKDVIISIEKGLFELENHPEKYLQYESPNGWGTIEGCKCFFRKIIEDWHTFCEWSGSDLINIAKFWII